MTLPRFGAASSLLGIGLRGALAAAMALASLSAWAVSTPQGLIAGRDCLSCHRVEPFRPGEARTLGPAFRLVAQRYRAQKGAEERLVRKILSGGNGQWGKDNMPPQILTEEEARTIVRWVLQLK